MHTEQSLYLDLLKKTLRFSLWDEPPAPITFESWDGRRSVGKQLLQRLAGLRGWQIVEPRPYTEEQRDAGHLWPMSAHTMIGRRRLDHLQAACETVLREGVRGDFIETGVWRGGSCLLMRGILAAHQVSDRQVWVADSFRGLPPPDLAYGAKAGDDARNGHSFLSVSRAEVEESFRRFGLLDEQVHFLEGWFKDTLPAAPITHLALMRLDGDLYQSTMDALTALYPKLSVGGYVLIDDYVPDLGAKEAVDDFRRDRGLTEPFEVIDEGCVAWRRASF